MTERFAMVWFFCWAGIIMLSFVFGLEAIPRALGHSTVAALALGAVVGAIITWPSLWIAYRDRRRHR